MNLVVDVGNPALTTVHVPHHKPYRADARTNDLNQVIMSFSPDELQLIDKTGQVHIETRRGDRSHRTVIWVVVDDGEVFVRSVRGRLGKWYQRTLADPDVTLHVAGRGIPAKAVVVEDEDSIRRTSNALRRKYTPGGSLDSMLRPEVLDTTLRLDPA